MTRNPSTMQAGESSALVFVARVILINIAIVLSVMSLATLIQTLWAPVVYALGMALVFVFSVRLALRSRGHRPRRDGSALSLGGSLSGPLAATGVLLLVLALLVPPEHRATLALLGLGGLFVARLTAFHPRPAWRPRLEPTVYVSPGGRARGTVTATAARKEVLRSADRAVSAHGMRFPRRLRSRHAGRPQPGSA